MKITDKKSENIKNDNKLNSMFLNAVDEHKHTCNILKGNFYLDSYNYFPITEDFYTFLDTFSWGDKKKYKHFYSKKFTNNFKIKKNEFKKLSGIYVLGSSPDNNYYRNLITFLPRLFYNFDKNLKLGIHRNSSNKFRSFINILCKKLEIKIQFFYLDDNFFHFTDSYIPEFINKTQSIKILNKLKNETSNKKSKVYISRQNCNYRNLINEDDVIKRMKAIGYEIIDLNQMSIQEQITIFSNANSIVSPTGSALANTVFCSKDTKVFEISPKYNHKYEDIFKYRYSDIAKVLNLDYHRLEADSVSSDTLVQKNINVIPPNILNESNYYKNLILKLDFLNNIN